MLMRELSIITGAHTIGTAACQFFRYRLYNFTSSGPDSTIDPNFLSQLQALCHSNGDGTNDVGRFDLSFFNNLENDKGVLESDQKLTSDASTKTYVDQYTGLIGGLLSAFRVEFARSMVKMSNIGVLTGTQGEIRKVCSAFNS
ncbi:Peroxidase N1 [Acorus calamus]|uniref:Peroxidase N1 n=1 Tax=Acorus calamus TaxID=4465 RepID=A0AAV9DKG7_ACOCL|nr:Peroxidase N1 [Acorus calamus]